MWGEMDSSRSKAVRPEVRQPNISISSLLNVSLPSPGAKKLPLPPPLLVLPHLFLFILLLFSFLSFLPSYSLCLSLDVVHSKQHQQKRTGNGAAGLHERRNGVYVGSGRSHPPHIHMLSNLATLVCGSCWQTEGRWATAQCMQMFIGSKKIQTLLFRNRKRKYPYTTWIMCKSVMSFKCMHYLRLRCQWNQWKIKELSIHISPVIVVGI